MAIVVFAPESAAELIAIMTKPHPRLGGAPAELPTGRYHRAITLQTQQLMVRLPSPVTLRLNALVSLLHEADFRASRRQLVSAIVLHRLPRGAQALSQAFDSYRTAPASAAGITGRPLNEILSQTRPKPGRRPMA
jgi:hypothetical protein